MKSEKRWEGGWAIVELMGHRRLGGKVSEANFAGAALLRLDVPRRPPLEGYSTQFYGGASVYCLTPTTEEIAIAVAHRAQPEPVAAWELPRLPASTEPAPGSPADELRRERLAREPDLEDDDLDEEDTPPPTPAELAEPVMVVPDLVVRVLEPTAPTSGPDDPPLRLTHAPDDMSF